MIRTTEATSSFSSDTPEIESIAVPSYEPRGPYGAKEVGEGSIANAIYDAIGVRIDG